MFVGPFIFEDPPLVPHYNNTSHHIISIMILLGIKTGYIYSNGNIFLEQGKYQIYEYQLYGIIWNNNYINIFDNVIQKTCFVGM